MLKMRVLPLELILKLSISFVHFLFAPLTNRELIIKLSPNVTDIAVAKAAEDGGATSISLINTIWGMAIDIQSGKSMLKKGIGGYSGIGIKPLALALTYRAAKAVDIPIIAMGGIYSWQDALNFFGLVLQLLLWDCKFYRSTSCS